MWWWAVHRVKDPDQFDADLERPLGVTRVEAVTQRELEQDEASFMAFAKALGIKPPQPGAVPSDNSVSASEG